jgi:4-hydroxythreonine-4-phosphate dehydrogenase
MRPLLAITMGDPVGIGAEVTVKAASVPDVRGDADLVVFGDPNVLSRAAREAAIDLSIREVEIGEARDHQEQNVLPVVAVSKLDSFVWGVPAPDSYAAQVEYVKRAFAAVSEGMVDAIVTAPISKASMSRAGAAWTGHTEMLADLSTEHHPKSDGSSWVPLMMLAGPTLKVVPLTTHIALADVPARVTRERVLHAITVTDAALRTHFSRRRPLIAVAGMNPHAGEGGLFGDEERTQISPAIEEARERGVAVSGPFPADTIFHRAVTGEFDVVIGMYHDQALIPIKLLDFDRAVNVTLGLPVIRTSVDHGTAYDIAGRGIASARSMIEAIRLAARMSRDGQRSRAKEGAAASA